MALAITPDLVGLLASKLQVGPAKPQGEIEIDHVLPASPAVAPTIVQTSRTFATAGASTYQHFDAATTPGDTAVLVWVGLWRSLTSLPQSPNDGETWEAVTVAHFYDDHDSPDPCELSAYKARVTIAQANHLLRGSTGGGSAGTVIRGTMWELAGADYDSITSITIQDQAAAGGVQDVGNLGVLDVGTLVLLAVASGDDGFHVITADPLQFTVDHFAGRDEDGGAVNSFYYEGFPVGWWGHAFGDGETDFEARVDFSTSHTWGGLAILVGPDASHTDHGREVVTTAYQTVRIGIDRSRKTGTAQLDVDLDNEDGSKGYYTEATAVFVPGNVIRAYLWLGDRANRVLRFTGIIVRPAEHRDPRTISLKALSRTRILLSPHVFLTTASQAATDEDAVRTEDNGVFLNRSPEYIAGAVLDLAGWPTADRDIPATGIVIPEYDLSDQGAWLDQIVGTDRLSTIAGWDYREDAAGVIHLRASPLSSETEPAPDWTFAPGVNVMAFDHQVDDEAQVTRVRVSGPMTSEVPIWDEEWSTTVIRHPVGIAYVPTVTDHIYVVDYATKNLYKLRLSDRAVVAHWYLGGSISYFPGGLCFDAGTGDFYVLDIDWVHGATSAAKIQRFDGGTKAHVATYSLPAGEWSAIKTDGSNLWLTNYGDDKLYKRSMTGVAVISGTITYLSVLQTNPTGLWIDGTDIGVFFAGHERFLVVDSSAPGTVTSVQSTAGTQITGGEKNVTTHAELWADAYDSSSGHVWAFDLVDEITTDIVKWAYDQDLEDALGYQEGIADRIHDLHSGDAAHAFDIRIATVELRTVNSPEQAQAVADEQLILRKRLRRVLDLATTGHPGVEVADVVAYPDAVSAAPSPWMVDTLREQIAERYTQTMSVLPWEAPA